MSAFAVDSVLPLEISTTVLNFTNVELPSFLNMLLVADIASLWSRLTPETISWFFAQEIHWQLYNEVMWPFRCCNIAIALSTIGKAIISNCK